MPVDFQSIVRQCKYNSRSLGFCRWEKKVEKAKGVTSKDGKMKVVADLLLEHKFTQNQVDLITRWVEFEFGL